MISSAVQGREVLHMIDAWACHNPHSEKLKALATHYCLALSLSLVTCRTSYQRNTTEGTQVTFNHLPLIQMPAWMKIHWLHLH